MSPFILAARGPGGGQPFGPAARPGPSGLGTLVDILVWFVLPLAIVAVIVYVILTLTQARTRAADGISPASPMPAALTAVAPPGWQLPEQILNERHATGEVSIEEYTQRLAALRQHRADGPSASDASARPAPAGG